MACSAADFKRAIEAQMPPHVPAVYGSVSDCWLTSNEVAAQVDIRASLARFYCSRLAKLGVFDEIRAMGGARYRVSKNASILQPTLVERIEREAINA